VKTHDLEAVQPIVDELCRLFTGEELVELAKSLEFDAPASLAVHPTLHHDRDKFFAFLEGKAKYTRPSKLRDVALYVALASRNGLARQLEKLLKLREQELAIIQAANKFMEAMESKGAALLRAAYKGE